MSGWPYPYSPADVGIGEGDDYEGRSYPEHCLACGRFGCTGDCEEGRATEAAHRALMADPATYAEPEY